MLVNPAIRLDGSRTQRDAITNELAQCGKAIPAHRQFAEIGGWTIFDWGATASAGVGQNWSEEQKKR
jgi:hypothetical protein